ncbi:MAG: DUF1028 domain-containing protein [Betaproteobacteria bacterium]|nr:DUF1028 domain-containing protein [Betaproteobacteria bacterium]
MTFSILARCPRTGQFGVAVTSSSIAVPARCGRWARAGVGVVGTQNITDPTLGTLGLDLMARGYGAQGALEELMEARPHIEFRQLALLDADGATAYYTGAKTLGVHAMAQGEGSIACGNLLANDRVPLAMIDAHAARSGEPLAKRLLAALVTGWKAGGEAGPVRSAGLYVVDRFPWPILDLRVDWHDSPIEELERVFAVYWPQMNDYIQRAVDPTRAPGYGVAGEK